MVTCGVRASASNIHKDVEALEIRPVVDTATAPCVVSQHESFDAGSQAGARNFTLVFNVTDTCRRLNLTMKATTLRGRLTSTIDTRRPTYTFSHPISRRQGRQSFNAILFLAHVTSTLAIALRTFRPCGNCYWLLNQNIKYTSFFSFSV